MVWLLTGLLLASTLTLGACQEECTEDDPDPSCQVGFGVQGQRDAGADHDTLPEANDAFTPEADLYCRCMLFSCHDPFHDTWGLDDVEAFDSCLLEISAVPVNGEPTLTGDFQECRLHFCQQGVPDCDAALGLTICQ